ncbi:hypothetical protein BO70DRAFT_396461 [Aspergillus heteromorphus CBS 117.55]|uniref:Zn(2)-C6 fungal-type domain-containing protein n=1 Tax=Aspergillus heteromorphus CBS 117.55 TaxID=1448321 RepID=A0A317W6Z4_9EURO|nr:uncharacterized protein BO70DRAFT_396461 [Aspergillus heteromorphus CBS 117.55]PWY82163.1 hypothetical protein BO70DRAFT_396461 [Aspergillus heteromorphus CBS 117.55]
MGGEGLPPTSETVAYPSAKRYACDRCRSHKLRCPRENPSVQQSCTRCIRAGAVCVTSDAKPLGRPSRGDPRPLPPAPASHAARHPSPPVPRRPQSVDMSTSQHPTPAWDHGLYPWSQSTFPSLPPLDDTPMLDGQMALSFPPMATYTPALTSPVAWVDPVEFQNLTSESTRETYPKEEMAIIQPRDRTEAVQRLTSLSGSLNALIDHLNTFSWDTVLARIACPSPPDGTTSDSQRNPFNEALKDTAEFVVILQALHQGPSTPSPHPEQRGVSPRGPQETSTISTPNTGSGHSNMSRGGNQPRIPPLSTPIILMVIACHMQILQMYDFIFSQSQVTLQAMPEEDIAGFRMLDGLQLAGIPLSQGHLQLKILIQVIEHQLHQIERLMGLPVEYRVAGRNQSYPGLLSSSESLDLLRASMSQTEGGHGKSGMQSILSLKESMRKVQQML